MTNFLTTVALLFCRRQYSSRILLHENQHYQLVEHRFPIRLCCCSSCYNMDSPYWWTSPRHHHLVAAHPIRQLDTLCRYKDVSSKLRAHDVWPNPHRSRPALCSLRTHSLLRPLVHPRRPRLRYRYRIPRKPIRWCVGPAHQSLPGYQSL